MGTQFLVGGALGALYTNPYMEIGLEFLLIKFLGVVLPGIFSSRSIRSHES